MGLNFNPTRLASRRPSPPVTGSSFKWLRVCAILILSTFSPLFAQTCSTNVSQVSSLCVTVLPSNPPPGSSVTVTATYCSSINGGDGTEFDVLLNSNSTTIQACPTAGQIFLVDTAGMNRDDTDPCAAAGQGPGCDIGLFDGILNPGGACVSHSVTWTLTIPSNV